MLIFQLCSKSAAVELTLNPTLGLLPSVSSSTSSAPSGIGARSKLFLSNMGSKMSGAWEWLRSKPTELWKVWSKNFFYGLGENARSKQLKRDEEKQQQQEKQQQTSTEQMRSDQEQERWSSAQESELNQEQQPDIKRSHIPPPSQHQHQHPHMDWVEHPEEEQEEESSWERRRQTGGRQVHAE